MIRSYDRSRNSWSYFTMKSKTPQTWRCEPFLQGFPNVCRQHSRPSISVIIEHLDAEIERLERDPRQWDHLQIWSNNVASLRRNSEDSVLGWRMRENCRWEVLAHHYGTDDRRIGRRSTYKSKDTWIGDAKLRYISTPTFSKPVSIFCFPTD